MRSFDYVSPTTVDEAVSLLAATSGAAILAGGTDLLSLMKNDVAAPKRLVNVKAVAGLSGIDVGDDAIHVGATTTLAELLDDEALAREMPALVQAAQGIQSPQIRNMGTVGGELCQRPRCWYFRAGFGLLAQHGGRSMLEAGDDRYHAIFGNDGDAKFVSPSSLAPALVALQATVEIQGPDGGREIPVAELYRTPAAADERELALGEADLVTGVRIPRLESRRSATYEVRHRHALDWPLATASVALDMEGDRVREARVVLGHVAPRPWPAPAAAARLSGAELSEAVAAAAASDAVAGARPLKRNGYKVQLARVAVERAILAARGESA